MAVIDVDQITLTGAVPSRSAADRLVSVASTFRLTPGTIVDNLTVDPNVPRSVGVRIVEFNSVRFGEGPPEIQPNHAAQLDRLVTLMTEYPSTLVLVIGNSDQRGDAQDNVGASQARADAVVEYLVGQGVDRSRFSTEAAGETNPVTLEETEEAYSLNRRIEFVIYGLLDV